MSRDPYRSIYKAIKRTRTATTELVEDFEDHHSRLGFARNVQHYLENEIDMLESGVKAAESASDEESDESNKRMWDEVKSFQDNIAAVMPTLERAKQAFATVTPPTEDSE